MDQDSRISSPATLNRRRELYGTALHLIVLAVLSLLLTWPVLIHGIPDLSHDGYHHARWAKQFCTQFWEGDLFPRWFTNVNAGFGGPSGFFSPPLANYVSSLFWPFIAHGDPQGWLAAGYPVVLGAILSGFTAYFWLLSFGNARAALLGSMLYVVAPYHLAIDVFLRGASLEFWVFVWFPLVLLSAEKLIRHSPWAIPGAAISFALAVLSHPTTSVCFVPIPVCYVFFFSEKKERVRNTSLMLASLLLGVGLSAAYILPAMLDQGKAMTQLYRTDILDYHNHWLIQNTYQLRHLLHWSSGASMSSGNDALLPSSKVRIIEFTTSTLLVAVLLFIVNRRFETSPRQRRLALFWVTVALITVFLMNRPSSFVWSIAGFLQFLQFPFRLNIMLVVCVAALFPLAYPHFRTPKVLTGLLCAFLVAWLVIDVHSSTSNFSAIDVSGRQRQMVYQSWIRTQKDPAELWPKPGNIAAMSSNSRFDWFIATHPPQEVKLEEIDRQSSGMAAVQSWQPRRIMIKIDALRRTVLQVNHFYYSGWQARIPGTSEQFAAYPSSNGLLQVDIPKGSYDLALELPRDGAEQTGIVLSILSALMAGACAAWAWRRRAKPESSSEVLASREHLTHPVSAASAR